jgi:hypothetical protein
MSAEKELILNRASALVELAQSMGLVLTVETQPRKPFAMGHFDMVVGVRQARKPTQYAVKHVPCDDTEGGDL